MNFTDSQQKAIDQIEKLLNLAAKAGTPAEAAAATSKAQELLTKHNLSTEALEDSSAKQSAKREEAKVEGGRYAWQRELWRAVAELNFCHYWQRLTWDRTRDKQVRMHCFIGRVVNTKATIAMAGYLEATIERMAVKRVGEEGWLMTSKWAFDYRRGAFEAVIVKLREERNRIVTEEEAKAEKAAKDGMATATGTALTVASFSKSEADANYDFKHGEGAAAERRQLREATAAYYARAEAAYTIWAAANPELAAEKFTFIDVDGSETQPFRSIRSYGGRVGGNRDNTDWSAYKAGRSDGDKIGLNPQTSAPKETKRLTGGKDIYL